MSLQVELRSSVMWCSFHDLAATYRYTVFFFLRMVLLLFMTDDDIPSAKEEVKYILFKIKFKILGSNSSTGLSLKIQVPSHNELLAVSTDNS